MASYKQLAVSQSAMYNFDPAIIEIDPEFNERILGTPELEEHIRGLMVSIAAKGVEKPLEIRLEGERIILVDGHNRLEAVKRLNKKTPGLIASVPCVPEPKGMTPADRKMRIYTSQLQLNLAPVEKANLFKKLLEMGATKADIAAQGGLKSVKQVDNILNLAGAPDEIKEMISSGEVSATTVIQKIKEEGVEKATETLVAAVASAKEQGKTKATAKTMAAPKLRPNAASDLLGITTPAPEPTPTKAGPLAISNYAQLLDAVRACLELDDLATVHTVLKDTLATINVPVSKN